MLEYIIETRSSVLTDMLHDPGRVQDKHSPQKNSFLFDEDAVVLAHPVSSVAQKGDVDTAQASIFTWKVRPMPKRMLRVHAHKHYMALPVTELVDTVMEGKNLCRAYETKRSRYEQENEPVLLAFAYIIG